MDVIRKSDRKRGYLLVDDDGKLIISGTVSGGGGVSEAQVKAIVDPLIAGITTQLAANTAADATTKAALTALETKVAGISAGGGGAPAGEYVPLNGSVGMTGNLNMAGQQIKNLKSATADADAMTRAATDDRIRHRAADPVVMLRYTAVKAAPNSGVPQATLSAPASTFSWADQKNLVPGINYQPQNNLVVNQTLGGLYRATFLFDTPVTVPVWWKAGGNIVKWHSMPDTKANAIIPGKTLEVWYQQAAGNPSRFNLTTDAGNESLPDCWVIIELIKGV